MKTKIDVDFNLNKEKLDIPFEHILWLAMNKMQELAIHNVPVDTGRLKNSIKIYPMQDNSKRYWLYTGVDYAPYVEFGTRPHPVSYKWLKDWARRKLGDESLAYAVANSIKKHGTRPHPFFRPALDEVKKIWLSKFLNAELRKA